jgi:hypothetical protein
LKNPPRTTIMKGKRRITIKNSGRNLKITGFLRSKRIKVKPSYSRRDKKITNLTDREK